MGNREFKELIEKVYLEKFDGKSNSKQLLDMIKVIPSFYYNSTKNYIEIQLKEDEAYSNSTDLSNFYNKLQNINKNISKEVIININCDDNMYKKVLSKYSDIIHFLDKPNTKFYTKKYYKEKIIVELQALEDILEYSIGNNLKIKLNDKNLEIADRELNLDFALELKKDHYYFILKQDIDKFYNIIYTLHNMYVYYDNKLYKCSANFLKKKHAIIKTFLNNYTNSIYIYKTNLTNFFSLVYPNIRDCLNIPSEMYERIKEYIPQTLSSKLYLDFNEKNYLVADLRFVYGKIEFNPIEQKEIKANRNIVQESIYLNKLIKSGFLLDEKNKRFIISNDDDIYNFVEEDLDEYMQISKVYTTTNFEGKKFKKVSKTSIGVKVNNNLLEINFKELPIDKKEIKEILQKYKLNKKYHRLKDGSFINLENNVDIKFLNEAIEELDISYKDIEGNIIIPANRSLYLNKLLEKNKQVEAEIDENYKRIIEDVNNVENKELLVPDELRNVLRDYQIIGNKWLLTLDQYGFGGILADDMGLGKTIQILSVLLCTKRKEKNVAPSLVVAPSSLTLNWKSEAEKFANDLNILVINGTADERAKKIKNIKKYDLAITSYDLLKRDIDEYEKLNYEFRYIIADEAQYIKNSTTQNSRAIKKLKSKTRFALTGTPIENALSELWSIFDFIMPGYLFSYKKFKKNYEMPISRDQDKDVLNKLKNIIEPFVLRRTKKEVLKELPDKSTVILNNEMLEEQEKVYLSYLVQARDEISEEIEDKGFEQSRIKILALLTRLRQICCHPSLFISNYRDGSGKLNQCIELVKEAIQSKHKILLFSGYTSMFEIIENELKKEGINYLKLTGKTGIKERFELIDKFNNNEDIKVFLISLKAGGTGINLTSADMVIHYDPWWNLSVENQATDRTHRIGQTKKVQVYKLITKNSIEEKIYDLQQRKKELIDNMLSTDTKFINKLSQEDIMKLFE